MATITSSDLDFDTIKSSLKTYFQSKTEFNDYNFEASGLSNILDVLAYNTHLNGLIANFGINESFLNSAQLRSSVVSHAENLGYYPRSRTGSSATITLSVASSDTATSLITLPKFSSFTADVDGTTYSSKQQKYIQLPTMDQEISHLLHQMGLHRYQLKKVLKKRKHF